MDLGKLINSANDPGSLLASELEKGLSPVTQRIDSIEKKLDLLLLTLNRVEALLTSLQPLLKQVNKLPFFK
jgi:hypothetical protein